MDLYLSTAALLSFVRRSRSPRTAEESASIRFSREARTEETCVAVGRAEGVDAIFSDLEQDSMLCAIF